MIEWMIGKLKLIDDIFNDVLGDIKSLRFQLLLISVGLNVWIINQIIYHNLNYLIGMTSLGTLTAVYAFYFHSKNEQAKVENQVNTINSDPTISRDPDGDEI